MRNPFAPLLALALGACGSDPADSKPADGEDDVFLTQDKSDAFWFIEDWSWDSEAVLRLVNDADYDYLYDVVDLSRLAAKSIAAAPKPIRSLGQLDDLSWVGPLTIDKLKRTALAIGYGPALAEEYPPDGEDAATQRTLATITQMLGSKYATGHMPRDQHAKAHGCVTAFFTVDEAVPDALRVGVFAEPGAEYPAWIRFSNGDGLVRPDADKDVRGFALKLLGVTGTQALPEEQGKDTQDFLLINSTTLMVRNVLTYADFTAAAQAKNQFSIIGYFLGLNPAGWELRGLKNLIGMISKKVASPLETRYWSTTPYLLGDGQAVKYSVVPCQTGSALPVDPGPNYLREALVAHLSGDWACFDFQVQVETDPRTMPIEDPTVEWSDKEAPFVTVARIDIPPQDLGTTTQDEFCENLSLTPWHSLAAHRPLGGINRARGVIYRAVQALRHQHNGAADREPEP